MQGDEQWRRDRAGKITASRLCDVLAFSKKDGKPLKARQDYIFELATERLTGEPLAGFTSKPTDYGKEVEPHGRAAYEAETGLIVELVDFVTHPTMPFVGASPDFFAGAEGGGELKCPYNSAVHLATLRDGMPEEHIPQVQGGLWVTGRKFWDFCSYDPRMPEHLRLYRQRVLPDAAFIAKLETQCTALNAEVEALVAQFRDRGLKAAA